MIEQKRSIVDRNTVFLWIGTGTFLILLIPLFSMGVTDQVHWNAFDFLVMGFLLFTTGSVFVLVSRRYPRINKIIIGVIALITFVLIWAEISVGVFTKIGS